MERSIESQGLLDSVTEMVNMALDAQKFGGIMARMPEDKFIACAVFPGMFADEYVVEIQVAGTTFSLFVDHTDVEVLDQDQGQGLLRVWIQDAEQDLIALPSETLEQGRRFMQYPIEKLKSA